MLARVVLCWHDHGRTVTLGFVRSISAAVILSTFRSPRLVKRERDAAMAPSLVDSFREQVIQPFQVRVPGRTDVFDYSSYLTLPRTEREGDEAAVVDSIFTNAVLKWLGFEVGVGATYNRTLTGATVTRPDYEAHGPISRAFICEDKATSEEFSEDHLEQLRRYVAGRSGYTIWSNARRILAHRFDATGRSEVVVDVAIEALFGSQLLLPSERELHENGLQLFHVLFNRSRFFDFANLVEAVSCDESVFHSRATPLQSEQSQRDFIRGSRTVLDRLRLAALTRIQVAHRDLSHQNKQWSGLQSEWEALGRELEARLASDLAPLAANLVGELSPRLGALHAEDILGIERAAVETRGGRLPPSEVQPLKRWEEKASRINAAARSLRLEASDATDVAEAFTVWRERQPDAKLATEDVFAEQVAYVFFVRLLLTRILEDKRLLPSRIASNGGFRAWRDLVCAYFGNSENLHISAYIRLLSERISTFYQHFFRQPLFDWFLPDDYLLVVALEFLGKYSFEDIGSDLIGFTYEEYIERVARNRKGHFLTRPPIVEYMLDVVGYNGPEVIGRRLIDPACGSGSFLVHAARRLRHAIVQSLCTRNGVDEATLLNTTSMRRELAREFISAVSNSLYGMDIDPFACYLAELNLLVQCLDDLDVMWESGEFEPIDSFRIFNTDSLDLPESVRSSKTTWQSFSTLAASASEELMDPAYAVKSRVGDYQQGFFYVICNPPYINSRQEKITTEYRRIPLFSEALSGVTNIYLLFVRLGIHYLATGGRMTFIVPLTLFGAESTRASRRLLTIHPRCPTHLVRFYTGNILFPGVDQAVCIFRVDNDGVNPATLTIAGGRTVTEAASSEISVARQEVIENAPPGDALQASWLVSPDRSAYGVWASARSVASGSLEELWSFAFDVLQGDFNATHVNPFRVTTPRPGDVAVYKGENVHRFAPLPGEPSDWVRPRSAAGLTGNLARANNAIQRIAGLTAPEDGFVLREVARLNTRCQLMATWFYRDSTQPIGFTHKLWRFVRKPTSSYQMARAIFGLISSSTIVYLLNLFSTTNDISLTELGRIPTPEVSTLDVNLLSEIVDDLLERRSTLQRRYGDLDARFPDLDEHFSLSPDAVLRQSGLPTVSLAALVGRGDIVFTGRDSTKLGGSLHRNLTALSPSPLEPIIRIFLDAHADERWGQAATQVMIPEPGVAEHWLHEYEELRTEFNSEWEHFKRRQDDLNDIIFNWYGFDENCRDAIRSGLPWAR